jgi:hypothetical protein
VCARGRGLHLVERLPEELTLLRVERRRSVDLGEGDELKVVETTHTATVVTYPQPTVVAEARKPTACPAACSRRTAQPG